MGISTKDFEKMRARLGGRSPRTSAVLDSVAPSPVKTPTIVLGIDPSLRGTGFGVIRVEQRQVMALAHGTIRCPTAWARSRCLVQIVTILRAAIEKYKPGACAIEGLFFAQNLQTALIMGEARGAALVAAAEAGLEIFEIAPRKVKQAIVGYGAAQKAAVAKMVQRMLHLTEEPSPDAADALALALAFIQETNRFNLAPPKKV